MQNWDFIWFDDNRHNILILKMRKLVEAIFTNVKSGNDFLLMAGRGWF